MFQIEQFEIVGGMDQLTQALANRLINKVNLSSKVLKIELNVENSVSLYINHRNQIQKETFDYVICTTPAPATSQIEFNPPLSSSTFDALRGVHYASSSKSIFHVKKRIWEIEDQIAGGGSFTNELLQQCWYPSDNSKINNLITECKSKVYIPVSKEVSELPAAFTASYTWEKNSKQIAALSDAAKEREIIKTL